jgi:sugar O-acyltransferase (sialic acid O-acetyltransferase NeuD family)
MTEAEQVLIPLLNPNEVELQLAALDVEEGDAVSEGQRLCTLESTKSTTEVYAERGGHIVGLAARVGDRLLAGSSLCWIADQASWSPPEPASSGAPSTEDGPAGLRITAPARQLANELGIDLASFPIGPFITEATVRALHEAMPVKALEPPEPTEERGPVLIYGAGGHGKSVLDLVRVLEGYEVAGYIDDALETGAMVMGLPVLGSVDKLDDLLSNGIHLALNAVGGVGDMTSRVRVFNRLIEAGFDFPTLVHPTAFVESSAELSAGVQVFPHAYVGSEAKVGFGSIVNTGAIVSHDCVLSSFVNVAPGACLAGGVQIGEGTLIGMSVTVNLNVRIGGSARIGNSAVIKADVPSGQVVRAGGVWP